MGEPKPPQITRKEKITRVPTPAEKRLADLVAEDRERSKGRKTLPLDVLPTPEYSAALVEVERELEEQEASLKRERSKDQFRSRLRKILNESDSIETFLLAFQSFREDISFQRLASEDIAEVLQESQWHIQSLVDISIISSDGDLKKFKDWRTILESVGIDFSKRTFDDTMKKFLDRKALDLRGHWWTPKAEFVAFTTGWLENGWRPQSLDARLAITKYNKGIRNKIYE